MMAHINYLSFSNDHVAVLQSEVGPTPDSGLSVS